MQALLVILTLVVSTEPLPLPRFPEVLPVPRFAPVSEFWPAEAHCPPGQQY